MWEDGEKTMRQLFHLVDSTWNNEGAIFGWHPQFKDKAQIVMRGSLPYLKSIYGATVESYFLQEQLLCSLNSVETRINGGGRRRG